MAPEQNEAERIRRANENQRIRVATLDEGNDWPMLVALVAGLTVALIANTFLGLISG